MTSVRLYSQQLNPFSEKVACALALKGVAYRRVEVTDSDEIAELSSESGLLPVLEMGGRRLAESPAILAWLEEEHPTPSLYAEDPKVRAQQQNLAEWSDSSFAYYWNRWLANREEFEAHRAVDGRGLLGRIHQHVEERIGREPREFDGACAAERDLMIEIAHRMDDLMRFLGSRDFFYADRISVADIAVYGMLLVMRHGPMPGTLELLSNRPALVAHENRLSRLTRDLSTEVGGWTPLFAREEAESTI
jgi:glutathione S-transferase